MYHSRFSVAAVVIAQIGLSALFALATARADVTVSTDPTQNMTCTGGVCSPTADKAVLNVSDLAGMLADGDVTVISDSTSKDIEISAPLTWSSASLLTLNANRAIAFNKSIVVAGAGGLAITTDPVAGFRFGKKGHIKFLNSQRELSINGHFYRLMSSIQAIIRELKGTDGSGLFLALQKSIGTKKVWSASPINKAFNGTFEGLGNTISQLTINSTAFGVGLFDSVDTNGALRDLHLTGVNISVGGGGSQFVGALTGGNAGLVLSCDAAGKISATGTQSVVGGLIGANIGLASNSSSSVVVSASGSSSVVGGLTGENTGSDEGGIGFIQLSYATGTVTGGDGAMVGGLAGKNDSAGISDSYATGSVFGGSGSFVGGLLGDHGATNFSPVLRRVYSTGLVQGGSDATVGGLIGEDLAGTRTTHAYWDLDTSGISDPSHGAGNVANDPGIAGLSDAQLKSGLPAAFDKKVWNENAKLNTGYPYLIDNPPAKAKD